MLNSKTPRNCQPKVPRGIRSLPTVTELNSHFWGWGGWGEDTSGNFRQTFVTDGYALNFALRSICYSCDRIVILLQLHNINQLCILPGALTLALIPDTRLSKKALTPPFVSQNIMSPGSCCNEKRLVCRFLQLKCIMT